MMAYLRDRAAVAVWSIRRIAPDITDQQARQIEDFLRDEFAGVKAEAAAERPVEE